MFIVKRSIAELPLTHDGVMKKMRVLYSTYPTAFNFFGGGEIQLLKTKQYVEKTRENCFIKLFYILDRLEEYDILHNFSMAPDCLSLCKMAKVKEVKIALSPIYWESNDIEKLGLIERTLFEFKSYYENLKRYGHPTFRALYPNKEFLELSDIILPNSKMEASLLSNRFMIKREKFHVVPNGVDRKYLDAKPNLFVQKHRIEDFVLFVGRIEARKNVLSLVNACKAIQVPLVIVGHASAWEHEYFNQFRKLIKAIPHIHYLGYLRPDSEELLSAYAAAKVFLLPSWYETPGLAALEAGLAGCNVVITNGGSTTEYFRDLAWYVDPASMMDIENKTLDAYETPKKSALRERILKNYTWESVAEQTLEAYDSIMNT